MKLAGNTVLITGGTRGIGFEFAKQFSDLGNTVIITGRDENKINEIRDGFPKIHAFKCEITNRKEIEDLFVSISKNYPTLNVLINNAGIGKTINLKMKQDESLTEELRTNLEAPINICNLFLPLLLKQKSSAVINITSALAFIPFPLVPIYSASKSGLRSFTQSLRTQLLNTNVHVFEIAPPSTQTEMLSGFSKGTIDKTQSITPTELVENCLTEIEKDNFEICPGKAKQVRFLARFAPKYLFKKFEKGTKLGLTKN